MNGKNKCKLLKEIRRQIAAENDIAYVTSECKYQGECSGTCPKCEAEVRYLEEQLRLRQRAGKAVAVAGIAAALMVSTTGCDLLDILGPIQGGKVPYLTDTGTVNPGEIPYEPENTEAELMGDVADIPEATGVELMGQVPDPTELMGVPLWQPEEN